MPNSPPQGALTLRHRVERLLARSPNALLPAWAVVMAFTTYFCMYAFRKPFSAGTFEGDQFLGTAIELKSAFVISQIIGYTISKYLGIKICAEVIHRRRLLYLFAAIAIAEFALLLFAILPGQWKVLALFLNGLPLGMVWGLMVSYLEGRRTSEFLLAGLSCSFILASGVVKDVGRWMMTLGISEYWMPFLTGLFFLPLFGVTAWFLNMTPEPNAADEAERVKRAPMNAAQRWAFMKRFAAGLSLLIVFYLGLTAFRDFRDNYGVEMFIELGYGESPAIFTRSELWVAFGVLAALVPIMWIRNNRRALMAVYGILLLGCVFIGGGTFLLERGAISGLTWLILVGLGGYFGYVPFNSVLFDRIVAATRTVGTAVFAIYLADAIGYTGSTALQLYKDLAQPAATRLEFFIGFSYLLAAAGVILLTLSYFDFARAAKQAETGEPGLRLAVQEK
jgi:MFS family permease